MSNRKPQILKGFRDYLPDQMILRNEVIRRFRDVFERHGFAPLDTPAIEYLEVLTGKAGENEKLMYEFDDHGGRRVGLRYDLTVPLARVVAMHENELVLPFKRYHIAPVWRAEKPQRGRFREFWQCDADIAGAPSPIADAEVISILADGLESVGLPNYQIQLSHRQLLHRTAVAVGIPGGHAASVYRSVDKLAKIGSEKVIEELERSGVDPAAGTRLLALISADGTNAERLQALSALLDGDEEAVAALGELSTIIALLPSMGVDPERVVFDPTLARGLDYYTGPVFEATVEEPKVGSVAGGGRYENLIGSFTNRTITATGVSLGMERILEVVHEFETLPAIPPSADVFVVIFAETVDAAAGLALRLRQVGLRVDLGTQPNRGVGDQLKYAGRKGIPFAVIAGVDELAAGRVGLKNLVTGEQIEIAVADLEQAAAQFIAAGGQP